MSVSYPLPPPAAGGVHPETACLMPLNVAPDAPTLFCVHAIDGSPLLYRPLVDHVTPALQVYGFECRSFLLDGKPFETVEEMARRYVRDLRAVQPGGPYRLFGFSSGGLVALEIAHQLRAAGEDVPVLVLADTLTFSTQSPYGQFRWCLFAEIFIAKELSDFFYADAEAKHPFWGWSDDEKLRFLSEQRPPIRGNADTALDETRRQHEIFQRYVRTYERYQPSTYDGPAIYMTGMVDRTLLEPVLQRLRLRRCAIVETKFRSHLQLVLRPGVAATARVLLNAVENDGRFG